MNVHARSRDTTSLSNPPSFIDSASFLPRTASVAAIAAAEAPDVDRQARFPQAAIDAARAQKLLGAQIPQAFGGDGASISDITDMCYTLGRACSSTAMIFAWSHDSGPSRSSPTATVTGAPGSTSRTRLAST